MYSIMFVQFIRSRSVILSLVLIMVLGMVSIGIGKQFLSSKEHAIQAVTQYQKGHIERNVEYHKDDLGLLLYYLKFSFVNQPDHLAGVSIGQSDVNPNVEHVSILSLEGQKYDTDLVNPLNLQSGNLDLSFVIIYLFPLLVIAFTFNMLSEELETGTWRIVAVQTRSKLRYLLSKLSVRAVLLYVALTLLLIMAKIVLDIPLNKSFGALVALSYLYLAFWFSLGFLVIAFQRSSSFNVVFLLSVWLVLVILFPAMLNNYMSNKYTVPEAFNTMISQRDGYHEKWDMDKTQTIESFYQHYPQFRKYGYKNPNKGFNWLWYYAMQQMGDDDSRKDSKAFRDKILQREAASMKVARFVPTMYAQLAFNQLAGTSLSNYLAFLDETTRFHERTRLFFYPRVFSDATVAEVDWTQFKPEYLKHKALPGWWHLLMPMLVFTLITSVASVFMARRV